jgi:CBS-domain-containing membrane protein
MFQRNILLPSSGLTTKPGKKEVEAYGIVSLLHGSVLSKRRVVSEMHGVTAQKTATKKTKTKLRGLSPRVNYIDRRLSAKLVPTFADRGCHVVSVTDPYGRILGFIDRSRYGFFQVAPQLYSRG